MKKVEWPSLDYENKYWDLGYEAVCGVDEVGRGSWAGPMYVGAVVFEKRCKRIKGVNDSKKLNHAQREKLHAEIIKSCKSWSIGVVEHNEIDEFGLTAATKMAIQRAVGGLGLSVDILLIDAFNYEKIKSVGIPKGDEKCYSIAAASILAKVERDKHMADLPEAQIYGFLQNKGYGTKKHQELIKKHGISNIHRRSFSPVRRILNNGIIE